MPLHRLFPSLILAVGITLAAALPSAAAPGTSTAPTSPERLTHYVPPPTTTVDEASLPSPDAAWNQVIGQRNRASPNSRTRKDLTWLIDFVLLSRVDGSPHGRIVTAQRALRVNAWWYGTRRPPNARVIVRDPDGVLLTYRRNHGFMVNPVATMGRWRDLNIAWSAPQLADAIAPMMIIRRYAGRNWGALEYYDVPGKPDAVVAGVSAMGQGRAAAFFARAWRMTGNGKYADAAELALNGFRVPVDAGGVFNVVRHQSRSGVWYPERAYPGKNPWYGAALNGFMVTLIGLRGSAVDLATVPHNRTQTNAASGALAGPDPDAVARAARTAGLALQIAQNGARSLQTFLPLHDSGAWSYYGLLTPGHAWRTNLADLNYHCYHVFLLRSLEKSYPGYGFGARQLKWQADVNRRGARCPAR